MHYASKLNKWHANIRVGQNLDLFTRIYTAFDRNEYMCKSKYIPHTFYYFVLHMLTG